MKRLFPAPPMSAILFVLWLVLSQHVGVATVAMAAILAIVLPLLTFPLRPVPMRVRRPRTAIALLLTVAIDAVESNLQVARSVWHFRAPPRSAFVRIPEKRISIIILTGDDAAAAKAMADRITDQLLAAKGR